MATTRSAKTETKRVETIEWNVSDESGAVSGQGFTSIHSTEEGTEWHVNYKGLVRVFKPGEDLGNGKSVKDRDDAEEAMIAWVDG